MTWLLVLVVWTVCAAVAAPVVGRVLAYGGLAYGGLAYGGLAYGGLVERRDGSPSR